MQPNINQFDSGEDYQPNLDPRFNVVVQLSNGMRIRPVMNESEGFCRAVTIAARFRFFQRTGRKFVAYLESAANFDTETNDADSMLWHELAKHRSHGFYSVASQVAGEIHRTA